MPILIDKGGRVAFVACENGKKTLCQVRELVLEHNWVYWDLGFQCVKFKSFIVRSL